MKGSYQTALSGARRSALLASVDRMVERLPTTAFGMSGRLKNQQERPALNCMPPRSIMRGADAVVDNVIRMLRVIHGARIWPNAL